MGFLYFLPTGRPQPTADDLRAAGLGHLVGEGLPTYRGTRGPGDAEGVVFAGAVGSALYKPAEQTWRKGPKGAYWVGLANDAAPGGRPGPAELARPRQIAGERVRLRDGNEWVIPIARSVVRGTTLPRELVLGEDGQTWETADLPEFLSLCQNAEKVFDLHIGGGQEDEHGRSVVTMPYSDAMRIAVEALAVNYRVGHVEAAMLKLFSETEMWAVLQAICDLRAFADVLAAREKKSTASASSPTGDGSPASSPGTCPPAAT